MNKIQQAKNKMKDTNFILVIDMEVAADQIAELIEYGWGSVKSALKFMFGTGIIRAFDYGERWQTAYPAFTKRKDTITLFLQKLSEVGMDLVIKALTSGSDSDKQRALRLQQKLKSMNAFMSEYIIPLVNDTSISARELWYRVQAVFLITKDIYRKNQKILLLDSVEFKLSWLEFQQKKYKLWELDNMKSELGKLDWNNNKNKNKQNWSERNNGSNYGFRNNNNGRNNRYNRNNYYARNRNDSYQHHQYQGRDKANDRYDRRRGDNNNDAGSSRERNRRYNQRKRRGDRDSDERKKTSRSRSRSRDRDAFAGRRLAEKPQIIPDFPEGIESFWDRKIKQYEAKDGKLYGHPKMEDKICRFWERVRCTFGNRRCKWHHMCKYCFVIGDHKAQNCPSRGGIRM